MCPGSNDLMAEEYRKIYIVRPLTGTYESHEFPFGAAVYQAV
jgi:hypothetical protein